MILNIIRQTISEYNLFNKGERVLIGLSGGADSVCLTYALNILKEELDIELFTAHINHGIRGDEATQDEQFAIRFSEKLGLKCFVKHINIPEIAHNTGQSEETAGRQARYDFFSYISAENGIDKIATAHNKNDNAETIIMNFIRGGSLSGLCGIPYKRGSIVRPLLNVERSEIEKYCIKNNLEFVTDSTNLENDYTRNKIRHLLIPQIENEFNINFISTVTANSILIREDNKYLDKCTKEVYKRIVSNNVIDIDGLLKNDISIQRRLIRMALYNFYGTLDGVSSVFIDDILLLAGKNSGKSINIHNNTQVKNEYGKLIITNSENVDVQGFEYRLTVGKTYIIDEIKKKVVISEVCSRQKDGAIYLNNNGVNEIILRNRKNGDRFYPSGMSGSKKIKEYFINSKVPKDERNKIPIIEIDGKIAAVGQRVDEHFLFYDKGIKIEFYNI